ncbi:CYTH and CHAD domain-containing protein [Cupriavidus sp. 8B]
MERELKLELVEGKVDQLRSLPLLKSLRTERPHSEHLVSTYFDTPDLYLHCHHVSLRVRKTGNHHVQTLKTQGSTRAGLYERDEFEAPIEGEAPDLDVLRSVVPKGSVVGKLIGDGQLVGRLVPVFTTNVQRTVSLLRLPQGDEVELALDDGTVQADNANAAFQEVEMEIKAGDPGHLYDLALGLLDAVPLRISRRSKGERGYALIASEQLEVVRAQPLELNKRDTVERAFQCIAQNCMEQIQGNERNVISGEDPSSVHQMRVGLRRLRSAMDLMGAAVVCPTFLQEELKWIAGELGVARDWEVLATSTLSDAFSGEPEEVDAEAVKQAASEIAREKHQRAAQAVDSVRYTRLIIELSRWLEQAGWRQNPNDEQRRVLEFPLRKFATKTLRERHRKVIRRGRGLADLDAQRRHRARIAAKKLRYATEFFASLYPRQGVRRYKAWLSKLQDDLGWRNDVVVADGLLRQLQSGRPETGIGAGYARGYLAACVAADHDALRALWKHFKRLSLPQ